MPIRLRLALWYGAFSALLVLLVGLLGFSAYTRGQYQLLDQVLLLSANHVEAGWRLVQRSYVLEADISDLEVYFRLYDTGYNLKRTSLHQAPLPDIHPGKELKNESIQSAERLSGLPLPLFSTLTLPPNSVFALSQDPTGQRWRVFITTFEREGKVLGYLEAMTPLGKLDASVQRLGAWLLGLGLFGSLGVFGLSLALARIALQPIARLSATAKQIAHSQDLSQRVEAGNLRDELGQLSATFNEMLESLEQTSHHQKRFVADASHELRAPLAIILGNLELLRRYPHMPDEERQQCLQMAERETRRLSQLVADLLTLAKSDARVEFAKAPVELTALAKIALREAERLVKGQTLSAGRLEDLEVLGNRDALKQLMLILLDNALKYTPPGGRVSLEVMRDNQQAVLRVMDSGIGIAEADLERVFERFYRADKARSRNAGGTGLGLSIAGWIVEHHGGTIGLDSALGQGTTATVRLPLVAQPTLGAGLEGTTLHSH